MWYSGISVNIRLQELRLFENFAGREHACSDMLGHSSWRNSLRKHLMKTCSLIVVGTAVMIFSHFAGATQADDTVIRIIDQTPDVTPFISKVTLEVSNTSVLKNIQFEVIPKPGSVTRPLSGTYANSYLVERGFENQQTGQVVLPVLDSITASITSAALRILLWTVRPSHRTRELPSVPLNGPAGTKAR